MLSLKQLLQSYGLNPAQMKFVRHSSRELFNILEEFKTNRNRFEAYQSFQGKPIFSGVNQIASFATHTGTSAIFLGIWDIISFTPKEDLTKYHHNLIDHYGFTNNSFQGNWHTDVAWYEMKFNDVMSDLSSRLVIDWGNSARSWFQSKDKSILEIKPNNSAGDFVSYDSVKLGFKDLKTIIDNPNSNLSWVSALKAVKGIYLIRDTTTDRIYVGSASGRDGLYGRWSNYANTGDGGNIGLQDIKSENLTFSILEIVSATFSGADILHRENTWKERLGARSENNLCHN